MLERALSRETVAHYESAGAAQERQPGGGRGDDVADQGPHRRDVVGVSAVARDVTDRKCAQQPTRAGVRHVPRSRDRGPHPCARARRSAAEVDVSVMFVDIRDFTGVAERLEPHEVVETAQRLFELAVPVITAHGRPRRQVRRRRPARRVRRAPAGPRPRRSRASRPRSRSNAAAQRATRGEPRDRRSAIHPGRCVAGNVGGGGRLDFTVIGDAVNTAARIEAATRQTGDTILFSEQTRLSA